MAIDSQTAELPSIRIGTLPAGEYCKTRSRLPGSYSGMSSSANGMPATFIAIHGRSDQEE